MDDPIEAFFSNYPPDIQAISRHLRAMVKAVMPHANEILYADQNHVGYSLTQSSMDRIVYICPMKNYVRLGFMRGTQLPDPDNLLVGEGKWLRHIKVKTLEAANHPALEPLLMAAWEYADAHMRKKK